MPSPDDIVCYCANVTRGSIVDAIANGATTLAAIQEATGAGIGSRCQELNPTGLCCHRDIRAILGEQANATATDTPGCSCCSDDEPCC